MADRTLSAAPKPVWMKQAEEARIKSEADTTAAAKAAFDATFKSIESSKENPNPSAGADESDSDDDRDPVPSSRPIGPADPSKCVAAGPGIAGGSAGSPSTFTVTAKDSDGRKLPTGGGTVKVAISPGVGVGGTDQEGIVKDQGDGTYAVTYTVPKRGNYMVHVEFNGRPITGSPFPVFFSTETPVTAVASPVIMSSYGNMVNQTMPNMPNYSGSVSGAFPGLMGMIPGMLSGTPGGSSAFPASSSMGTLTLQPMAPSAAAMAAAQAIVAARHATQLQAQAVESAGSLDEAGKTDALKRTLQVSNLSPLLTAEQLKQLFAYCGTVVYCTITDSKHFAYIEYSKPEEAAAALALNNMDVGGRPLNVEMAKSLPSRSANTSIPLMMQQAVALQQMQFQQSLVMQQTMASQQAASRAATMKFATDMASSRAAEISKKLKAEGLGVEDEAAKEMNRSPSPHHRKSKSRSRSPIKYRRSRTSRSISPSIRFSRDRRSQSPMRSYYSSRGSQRRAYRGDRGGYSRGGRWDRERSRDHYSSMSRRNRSRSTTPRSRRNRSRSTTPRPRRSARVGSISPKHHRESSSPRTRRSSQAASRSPKHSRGSRSSPKPDHRSAASCRSRHSRSRSAEGRHHSNNKEDSQKSEKLKHNYHRSRQSRSRSEEGKRHINNKEDTQNSEKLKCDSDKSSESREDKSTKDLRELKGDLKAGTSAGSHKRSSNPDDVFLKNERDNDHHKKSKLDGLNADRSDDVTKDCNFTGEGMESKEDRSIPTPILKEHKKGSACDNDDSHAEYNESSRHERSGPSNKKHERSDSATKESDSMSDELTRSREDRRPSLHSSSRSHRTSRHLDERSSRDSKDHRRQGRSREDYKKLDAVDTIVKEGRSSGRRHERTVDSSNMDERSSSHSTKDKAVRHADYSRGDAVLNVKRPSEDFDSMANNVGIADGHLTGKVGQSDSSILDDFTPCPEEVGRPGSSKAKFTKLADITAHESDREQDLTPKDTCRVGENLKRLEPCNEHKECVGDADINCTRPSNQIRKVDSDYSNMEVENVQDVSKSESPLEDRLS